MIQISADRQRARCVRSANERITTGLTGKTVTFRLGEGWENVTARTAVFEGSGVTKDCLIENGAAVIPHECLTVPGGVLRCGVYGVEGDKRTPTVYAELGQIERGADPSGDTSTDPTLAVWAQILAKMGSLDDLATEAKNTLVAAINEAAQTGGGGGTVTEAEIEKALGYKPIGANDVPVKKVNGATGEVKSTFYVTVTPTGNGYAATADKTAAEVYAAYVAGYAVYAVVKFENVTAPFELPLVSVVPFYETFMLGFGALGSLNPTGKPQYPTVAYTGTEWLAWLGTLARSEDIGDLDDLTTTAKNNLVAAINEAAASGGGGGGSVTKDSIVTALGYTPADAPDALICTITGSGTDASPYACDKTTAEIDAAIQAGKTVQAKLEGFYYPLVARTSVQSCAFAGAHMAANTVRTIIVNPNGAVAIQSVSMETTGNKTTDLSASSTNTQYPGAKAVWDALPHPEAKTDAMTQPVGKDADGKLWTAPGGGSGGETWEKLVDASLAEAVESVTYTFDNCKRIKALIAPALSSDESVNGWKQITINNVPYPSVNSAMRSYEGVCFRVDSEYPPYVRASVAYKQQTSTHGINGGQHSTVLENIAPNGITEFGCKTAGLLKAGTKIEIWGVKS